MPHHVFWAEMLLSLFFSVIVFLPSVDAADVSRLRLRSLFMYNPNPGVVTDYKVSFTYSTTTTVGSVDMLFCTSPIPDDPCYVPVGLDLSNVSMGVQTGETGYDVQVKSPNHIVLSRATPAVVDAVASSYTLHNVKNPTDDVRPFSIRLSTHSDSAANNPVIDLGSVVGGLNNGIFIETQVPPTLMFCLGQEVSVDCSDVDGVNYHDMGNLAADTTLTAQSQMSVGTNATSGFAITVNGTSMKAGNNVIDAVAAIPTTSITGKNQFGINLVKNTQPEVGGDPDGDDSVAAAAANYDQPNRYFFRDGDVVASSPHVSLLKRFTVSYIVNTDPNLRAGVYSTTITYICSGRF